LRDATPEHFEHTVWFYVLQDDGYFWRQYIAKLKAQDASDQDEAAAAFFGETIPAAGIYLGHGKPIVLPKFMPVLDENTQYYWRQDLGYEMSERQLRKIVYDAAFVRNTWQADKTERTGEVSQYKELWQNPPIVGIGKRVGPFWFPEPDSSEES